MINDSALTLLIIGGMLWFFYGPWQNLCVDFTRQLLFEQRDYLFDLAMSERLSFDDPNYILMRKSIQRSIRFAHVMTVPKIVYLAFVFRGVSTRGSGLRDAAISVGDAELRKELVKVANKTAVIVVISVLMRSLILFPLIPEAFLLVLLLKTFDRCRNMMVRQLRIFGDLVQREAEFTS